MCVCVRMCVCDRARHLLSTVFISAVLFPFARLLRKEKMTEQSHAIGIVTVKIQKKKSLAPQQHKRERETSVNFQVRLVVLLTIRWAASNENLSTIAGATSTLQTIEADFVIAIDAVQMGKLSSGGACVGAMGPLSFVSRANGRKGENGRGREREKNREESGLSKR